MPVPNVLKLMPSALALALLAPAAWAGPIGVGNFSGAASVVNMAGAPANSDNPSFSYQGLQFSEAGSGSGAHGWVNLTGYGLGYADTWGVSDITISLGAAYERVGLDIYLGPAEYRVDFLDRTAQLLGSITSVFDEETLSMFVGWESATGVAAVRIQELSGDNGLVAGFDSIRYENLVLPDGGSGGSSAVPEPGTGGLVALALGVAAAVRRRRG